MACPLSFNLLKNRSGKFFLKSPLLGNLPGDILGKSAFSHANSACTYGRIACTAGDRIIFRWTCGRRPIHLSASFFTSCLRFSGAEPPHFRPVLVLCAVFRSGVVSALHSPFKNGTQAQQRRHATHATHATQVLRPPNFAKLAKRARRAAYNAR